MALGNVDLGWKGDIELLLSRNYFMFLVFYETAELWRDENNQNKVCKLSKKSHFYACANF